MTERMVLMMFRFTVSKHDGTRLAPDDLHDQGGLLMEALLDLEACNGDVGMCDSTVSTDALSAQIDAEFSLHGDDDSEVVRKAQAIVRSAIHTIGGYTPGWPAGGGDHQVEYRETESRLRPAYT